MVRQRGVAEGFPLVVVGRSEGVCVSFFRVSLRAYTI